MNAARGVMLQFHPLAVRWHGRGGFGAKTAAALLAELVIDLGGYGQAAPEFGPERRGAPVQAYTRIAPTPICRRGPISEPDVLVVLDAGLLALDLVAAGVGPHTRVVVNAPGLVAVPDGRFLQPTTIDASRIARVTVGRDIPNIPMLAAVVTLYTTVGRAVFLWWLQRRLRREFRPEVVDANTQAAEMAIEEVGRARTALAGA